MLVTKNYLLRKEYYVRIEKGEDLSSIAKKTLIPIGCIIKNNPDSEFAEGDMIKIPKLNGLIYQSKPMETAEDIAEKFHTETEKLLEANNIKDVQPFMKIVIPYD